MVFTQEEIDNYINGKIVISKLQKQMEEIANMPKDNTPYVRQSGEMNSYEKANRERYERLQRSKLSEEQREVH